jgi:hypothetical protein
MRALATKRAVRRVVGNVIERLSAARDARAPFEVLTDREREQFTGLLVRLNKRLHELQTI